MICVATMTTTMTTALLFSLLLLFQSSAVTAAAAAAVQQTCLADEALNDEFRALLGDNVDAIPRAGSCCQADVCGIPCPVEVSAPKIGKSRRRVRVDYAKCTT
jgi:hypothetical protein